MTVPNPPRQFHLRWGWKRSRCSFSPENLHLRDVNAPTDSWTRKSFHIKHTYTYRMSFYARIKFSNIYFTTISKLLSLNIEYCWWIKRKIDIFDLISGGGTINQIKFRLRQIHSWLFACVESLQSDNASSRKVEKISLESFSFPVCVFRFWPQKESETLALMYSCVRAGHLLVFARVAEVPTVRSE